MGTLEDLTALTAFNDDDIFHFRRPGTDIDYYITGLNLKSQIITASNFVDVSADKTITEASGTTYFVTAGTGLIEITMPSPAASKNNFYTIIKIDAAAGNIKINPAASETIGGVGVVYLFQQTDVIVLRSDGVNWHIVNDFKPYFKSGWINRSDWTNVHLGFLQPNYDNLSGTFTAGETITGGTSGTTTIIINDTGSQLTVVNVSGGTNNFTNNEQITGGTSGATADINEATGSTKDVDSNILHNWDADLNEIEYTMFFNSSASFAGAFNIPKNLQSTAATDNLGGGTIGIDSDSFKHNSGANGIMATDDTGTGQNINTEDWYYNLDVRLK